MSLDVENMASGFEKLETAVYAATDRIGELKKANRELKSEVNELKRLLALSEKKADRLSREVSKLNSDGKKSWKNKEQDIKNKLARLSAKISAFENSYSMKS